MSKRLGVYTSMDFSELRGLIQSLCDSRHEVAQHLRAVLYLFCLDATYALDDLRDKKAPSLRCMNEYADAVLPWLSAHRPSLGEMVDSIRSQIITIARAAFLQVRGFVRDRCSREQYVWEHGNGLNIIIKRSPNDTFDVAFYYEDGGQELIKKLFDKHGADCAAINAFAEVCMPLTNASTASLALGGPEEIVTYGAVGEEAVRETFDDMEQVEKALVGLVSDLEE